MKDCKKIHPLLSDHLDGALSPRERSRVESHLKICAEARKELEDLRKLQDVLVALPAPPMPQDLHQKIMAKVKGHPMPSAHHRPFWVLPAGTLAVAAMVAVIVLIQNPAMMDFERTRSQAPVIQQSATPGTTSLYMAGQSKPQTNLTYSYAPQEEQNKDLNLAETEKSNSVADGRLTLSPKAKKMRPMNRAANNELALDKNLSGGTNIPAASLGPSAQTMALGASFGGSTVSKTETNTATNGTATNYQIPNTTTFAAVPAAAPPAANLGIALPTPTPIVSWGGSLNPSTTESQELVTDPSSFKKYWEEFQPGQPLPTVDFTIQAVVVLMDQERPSAGYSIHITNLEDKPDQLVIHYTVATPAPGAVAAQVLTRPWALQIISKPSKPVVFQKD